MSRALALVLLLCAARARAEGRLDIGFVDLATTQSPTLEAGLVRLVAEELQRCAVGVDQHFVMPTEAATRVSEDQLLADRWPLQTFDKSWLDRAGRALGVQNVASAQLGDDNELALRVIAIDHNELTLARRLQLDEAEVGEQLSAFAEQLWNAVARTEKERHCKRAYGVSDWRAIELYERARSAEDPHAAASLALSEPEFAIATQLIKPDDTPPPFSLEIAEQEAREKFGEAQRKDSGPQKQIDKWRARIAQLMLERKFSRVMAYARIALPSAAKDPRATSDFYVYLLGAEEALGRVDEFTHDADAFAAAAPTSIALATVNATRQKLAAKAEERRQKQPLAEKELHRMSPEERRDPCRVGRLYRKDAQRGLARIYLEACVSKLSPNAAPAGAIAAWQDLLGILVELGDFADARARLAELERRDPRIARGLRPLANSLPVE